MTRTGKRSCDCLLGCLKTDIFIKSKLPNSWGFLACLQHYIDTNVSVNNSFIRVLQRVSWLGKLHPIKICYHNNPMLIERNCHNSSRSAHLEIRTWHSPGEGPHTQKAWSLTSVSLEDSYALPPHLPELSAIHPGEGEFSWVETKGHRIDANWADTLLPEGSGAAVAARFV